MPDFRIRLGHSTSEEPMIASQTRELVAREIA